MLLNLVYFFQVIVAVALIVAVMTRTGKDSGLGALGGGAAPTSRFKPGFEQRLDNVTRNIAIAFLFLCFMSAYLNR